MSARSSSMPSWNSLAKKTPMRYLPGARRRQMKTKMPRPSRTHCECWANSKSSSTCSQSRWTRYGKRGSRWRNPPRMPRDIQALIARRRCPRVFWSASTRIGAVLWSGQMVWVSSVAGTGTSTRMAQILACVRPTTSTMTQRPTNTLVLTDFTTLTAQLSGVRWDCPSRLAPTRQEATSAGN